ncbi:proline--tRNA ligase [Candidatus Woesearchaeota archaeon]|nr:proline--tRNA ligase [Candidatus Woesearchaeota archaeon]
MPEKINTKGLTVKKDEDMPEWYTQVILKSELADYSAVKGCAVIRPLGYDLWQSIMDYFNIRLKALGVRNAYFPLFIPESFFAKEADHVEGFAPEVAWVEQKSKDEERLALRPTSETVMYDSYAKWIRSHRDLPLLINQWCNIVRWEVKDVKLFLRSREFLWQEGHCVFETEHETDEHVLTIIKEYQKLSEELLAVPATIGLKSEKETFAGAKRTYTIEQFMPDGKALQAGTSHNLGQGFAKAFNITYKGKDEQEHEPWQASWGFSTRLLGAIIMTHGDDKGLVLPPRIAPIKAVIIPITKASDKSSTEKVLAAAKKIHDELGKAGIAAHLDDRDEHSPGFKYNEWELKGVPIRIEVGPKDVAQDACVLVKRNDGKKQSVKITEAKKVIPLLLDAMQQELLAAARKRAQAMMVLANDYESLRRLLKEKKFVLVHHCGGEECEDDIKADTEGATTRCRPLGEDEPDPGAICVRCGKPAKYKIIFGRNY